MDRRLAFGLAVTDIAFLVYWTAAGLAQAALINIPSAWMYAGYDEPRVVAWNWSFLPIDVAFSVTGLLAVAAARRGDMMWRPLALVSLILTVVAGLMAVSYWTLFGEFDPSWFLPNLALVVWPMFFLPVLVTDLGRPA